MANAMKLLSKKKDKAKSKPKKANVDAELDDSKKAKKSDKTKTSSKSDKKAKSDKKSDKAATKSDKKKSKDKSSKKEKPSKEAPSADKIKGMKESALDKYHGKLPEPLDGWDGLSKKQKRKALISALHGEEAETEEVETKAKKRKAAQASDNVFENTVYEIENLSEESVDDEVKNLLDAGDYTDFKLGGVLAFIDDNKLFGDYDTFREKVEADYGINYRKARYLVETYNNIYESGVPWKKLEKVGWTKLKEIAPIITEENVDEWVAKAKEMNTVTLIAAVKAFKSEGKEPAKASKSTVSEVSTFTCKVHADQKENIEAALDKAFEELQTDVKAVALDGIAMEYLAGGKKKAPTLTGVLQGLKKKHGKDEDAAYEEFVKVWNSIFKKVVLE